MSGGMSSRGLSESNGRAVISALKTLEAKIKQIEVAKLSQRSSDASSKSTSLAIQETNSTNTETDGDVKMKRVTSSRRSNSIGTDSESSLPHRARSRSELNLIQTESSKRSKNLEHELSLADERCKLLEERLNQMRDAFARSENIRNKQMEDRIRLEREKVAQEYTSSVAVTYPIRELTPKLTLERFTDDHSDENDDLEIIDLPQKKRIAACGSKHEDDYTLDTKCDNIKISQAQKIPFCAARSTQPSHNVGMNVQGLMHQLKTKNKSTKTKVNYDSEAAATSSSSSGGPAKINDEIISLKELMVDLESELGDITRTCREPGLGIETLQARLCQLEKKGQQILVVKKLLKKKEENLRSISSSTISSRNKVAAKSGSSQRPGGVKAKQNRILLREVKKMTNQFQ